MLPMPLLPRLLLRLPEEKRKDIIEEKVLEEEAEAGCLIFKLDSSALNFGVAELVATKLPLKLALNPVAEMRGVGAEGKVPQKSSLLGLT